MVLLYSPNYHKVTQHCPTAITLTITSLQENQPTNSKINDELPKVDEWGQKIQDPFLGVHMMTKRLIDFSVGQVSMTNKRLKEGTFTLKEFMHSYIDHGEANELIVCAFILTSM